jgi:ABC-2 type transport system ATP-binding protein
MVSKRFGQVAAVSELTLAVGAGEVVGFLGPNGAGKTTTIRMLLGFISPTSGSARILGRNVLSSASTRSRIGYLPGDLRVDGAMTGNELFEWFGRIRGRRDRERIDELVDRLNLDPTRAIRELSKGNRQKVGIVQAFQHDPQVLILDEPTSGLDPLMQREFQLLVREAAERGAGVLLSSHVLPEVEHVAARVLIIREGKLVAESSMRDLVERARHRLELHFSEPPPEGMFRDVPGVTAVSADGSRVTIAIDGSMDPAMRAAMTGPELLRVTPAGDELEDLFESLYTDPRRAGE